MAAETVGQMNATDTVKQAEALIAGALNYMTVTQPIVGCPRCPPQWVRCPCGEMVLIEPDASGFLEEVLKKYKEKS